MQSIRTKIFLGFFVLLVAFGIATSYGAWAVHTIGQQLRLVALGYSALRLEIQDQLTIQANLQRRLSEREPGDSAEANRELGRGERGERNDRGWTAIVADRRLRLVRLHGAEQRLSELKKSLPASDAAFLDEISRNLAELESLYGRADAAEEGKGREAEEQATRLLQEISMHLTTKVDEVVAAGERYEARSTWVTVLLTLGAAACGALVLVLVQATLRPLRRLCDSAREVARGNYRERVALDTPDEVGTLAREFNAMAAALEEREQRLRRSEQLATVGKMAAQITHEVRNPLTSIGLNAELLADEFAATGSESGKLAQAIVKEVDRLTEITEQYLRFARLPEPRFDAGDVNDLLRSLLQFAGEELRARGVRVKVELDPSCPKVLLDDNQVRQALLNLIRNAAEAMNETPEDKRELLVRTRGPKAEDGPKGRVAIDISDRGPGIPAERQQKIFEPFFTTKRGGTGLGLSLALEVVARHGGSIEVKSPVASEPPVGTRFTIEIPAETPPPSAEGDGK